MRESRLLLVTLGVLVLLGFFAGVGAAVGVGVAMLLSVGINRWLPAVIAYNEERTGQYGKDATSAVLFLEKAGMVVAVISAVALLWFLGWLPPLVFVILLVGYYGFLEEPKPTPSSLR